MSYGRRRSRLLHCPKSSRPTSLRAEGLPVPLPAVVLGQRQLARRTLPAGFHVHVGILLGCYVAGPPFARRVHCPDEHNELKQKHKTSS